MYLLLHEDLAGTATTLRSALTHADHFLRNLPHAFADVIERWAVPHPELQQCCKIEAQPADVSLPLQPLL